MAEQEIECENCGSTGHSKCCGAGIEAGEVCLFSNMPWIHENLGSQLERELAETKEKIPEEEWKKKLDLRIAVGKHDLRRRGYD